MYWTDWQIRNDSCLWRIILCNLVPRASTVLYYLSGSFPCSEIRFILARDIGFTLLQVYFPSSLIVFMSLFGFVLDVNAIGDRISIGTLMMLSILTLSGLAQSSLPQVPYVKALDVWLFVCTMLVFLALIQFAVLYMMVHHGRVLTKSQINQGSKVGIAIHVTCWSCVWDTDSYLLYTAQY